MGISWPTNKAFGQLSQEHIKDSSFVLKVIKG